MSVAGLWSHGTQGGAIEITEDKDTTTIKHFVTGSIQLKAAQFYCGASKTKVKFFGFYGDVGDNEINWSNNVKWIRGFNLHDLPDKCTARDQKFPEWDNETGEQDKWSICFNIKPDDMKLRDAWQTDASFFWQGTYFEMTSEGIPKSSKWSTKLGEIADKDGSKQVEAYVKAKMNKKARAFWSPAKVRRWGKDILVPESDKTNDSENLLILEDNKWSLVEVAPDGKDTLYELPAYMWIRITYPVFWLVGPPPAGMAAEVYSNYTDDTGSIGCSEPAWINGSTVVRTSRNGLEKRWLTSVPKSFKPIRYIPLALRAKALNEISKVPSCALTGATLMPNTQFASPLSKQIAEALGDKFGRGADTHGIRIMASGSMRGHAQLMSADHDFTYGFCKNPGCQAVHFKGSNIVALHGAAWEINHGITYMIEEEEFDFSNHAKEAALMASLCNGKSISFLANGGPTVAINLSRMLLLCEKNRVFTFTGLHSKGGKSGASGGFSASKEKLQSAVDALNSLSPQFFGERIQKTRSGDEIVAALAEKPLRLLSWDETQGCIETHYTLKPDSPNNNVYPGIFQKNAIEGYAAKCSEQLHEELAKVA